MRVRVHVRVRVRMRVWVRVRIVQEQSDGMPSSDDFVDR